MSKATAKRVQRMSKEKCEEWIKNPHINPLTGAAIRSDTKTKGVYQMLEESCFERYGLMPGTSGAHTIRMPKNVVVPKTQAEWDALLMHIDKYIRSISDYQFYYAKSKKQFETWKLLLQYGSQNGFVAEDKMQPNIVKLTDILSKEARDIDFNETYNYDDYIRIMLRKIMNQENLPALREQLAKQSKQVELYVYLTAVNHPDVSMFTSMNTMTFNEIYEYFVMIEALVNEIQLQPISDNGNVRPLKLSRSRNTPSSMSDSSSRSRQYDASYKSHKALSEMSPISSQLTPLPEKKRQQLLQELKQSCVHMKDMITLERFDRMPKKSLQLVVQLGKDEKKRCYYVRNLYDLWNSAKSENKKLMDPLRNPITTQEQDEIMKKVKYIDPHAVDLRKDMERKMDIALKIIPIEMPVNVNGMMMHLPFFQLQVQRTFGKYTFIIVVLGYIPANIEPEDVGGALNLSSAVIIANLQRLFQLGRLMSSNIIPYRCCKIHLRKSVDYWIDADAPKFISIHRVRLMAEEIEQYL